MVDIARAEVWNDADNSGTCDNAEIYTDENKTGQWDSDIGLSGNGSAGDVVVLVATVEYNQGIFGDLFVGEVLFREDAAFEIRDNRNLQPGVTGSDGDSACS